MSGVLRHNDDVVVFLVLDDQWADSQSGSEAKQAAIATRLMTEKIKPEVFIRYFVAA